MMKHLVSASALFLVEFGNSWRSYTRCGIDIVSFIF